MCPLSAMAKCLQRKAQSHRAPVQGLTLNQAMLCDALLYKTHLQHTR